MVGQNIGKYRVIDRIGRGGMGTVYRAIDETLHREVAIKVLNAELNDPAVARRFRAEAVTVARLSHPGIATVYELFQHEGEWLMVMEFVRGETLEALVTRKGPLAVEESADISMQALGALAHAHSLGVVHRDLKPANLMLTESGIVKIMDFGIARVAGTEHLTSAGFMMGTPAYMAPEQVLGEDIDARADLYAMGVVLYHLVTGQLPFKGTTPFEMAQSRLRDQPTDVRSVRSDLPAWLGQVLSLVLDRQPVRRYQTAPLFREALRRGLANLPLDTPAPTTVPPELIATAAPSSMPVLTLPTRAVPAAKAMTSNPIPAPAALPAPPAPAATVATRRPAPVVSIAIAAGLVVLVGLGGWMWTRSGTSDASVAAPVQDAAGASPASAPAAPPVATPVEGAVSASVAISAPPPAANSVAPASGTPVTSPVPPAASGISPGAAPLAADGLSASAPGLPPAGGRASRGRGAAALAADAPAEFKDVRLLVVTGRRAEERPVVLTFGDGRIAAVAEGSRTTFVALPYREVSYGAYTRGRDPRWSVVLAAPPADVDMPGSMFRSARHWLTLQSRSVFLIARMNDSDWRRIIDTVTARTGVSLAQPATGSR